MSLMARLSSYNHIALLKQMRKKRHGTTSRWLSKTEDYKNWLEDDKASIFWCSGILGSGKTVLTAAIIDDIFCRRLPSERVSFFFCRYDEEYSLKSRTILGSLLRQALETGLYFPNVETRLAALFKDAEPDTEDLKALFADVIKSSPKQYIIIDGLDECAKSEKDSILSILDGVLSTFPSKVKIFLAGRESIGQDLKRKFGAIYHRSMRSREVGRDIQSYIEDIIRDRYDNGDLVIGDENLLSDIRDALIKGAQGMFLWVYFQLQDLCEQQTDDEIREMITSMPKDLDGTYERILRKIIINGKSTTAGKVFKWVAVVKRPLSLDELREAIAIEPCQECMKPERLLNDANQITSWCGNLVIIDEEEAIVQFAHHSTKQYFLNLSHKPELDLFQVDTKNFDRHAGDICVTYLDFNDFQRQLIKHTKPSKTIEPKGILETSLASGSNSGISRSLSKLPRFWGPRQAEGFDIVRSMSRRNFDGLNSSAQTLQVQYAFLGYAREFWLAHTIGFTEGHCQTWTIWKGFLGGNSSLAVTPWTASEWASKSRKVIQWIIEKDHTALFSYWISLGLPASETRYVLQAIFAKTHSPLLTVLIETPSFTLDEIYIVIEKVMEYGNSEIIKTLVDTSMEEQPQSHNTICKIRYSYLLIREAVRNCNEQMFKTLLDALLENGFDLDYQYEDENTLLHYAAIHCQEQIVGLLSSQGASLTNQNSLGLTARDIAHSHGHGDINDILWRYAILSVADRKKYKPGPLSATARPNISMQTLSLIGQKEI